MQTYLLLLRGINVGGKNKIRMAELQLFLETEGCSDVTTYIQSGNVIVKSNLTASVLSQKIEEKLPKKFQIDSDTIKILALTKVQLQEIVDNKPEGFGDQPEKYHSDVIFLLSIAVEQVMPAFSPLEGVDVVWPGNGVIYSQRLSAERTKSRLNKIMTTKFYKHMTIRNWNTTTKLLKMIQLV